MLVSAHQIKGILRVGITAFSVIMSLDLETTSKLKALLGDDNTTYLAIREPNKYEIVKVSPANETSFLIARGIDGTTPQNFSIGATVEFVIPIAAIQDIADEQASEVYDIQGTGVVQVTKVADKQFIVNVDPLNIISLSSFLDVSKSGDTYGISLNSQVTKCIQYYVPSNPS